jgi:hypothetical protein
VVDIKSNEARLISHINYELGTVTVLAVLTYKKYGKEGGKVSATAERLPSKYLLKDEAPKTISSPQQQMERLSHRFHISPAVFF